MCWQVKASGHWERRKGSRTRCHTANASDLGEGPNTRTARLAPCSTESWNSTARDRPIGTLEPRGRPIRRPRAVGRPSQPLPQTKLVCEVILMEERPLPGVRGHTARREQAGTDASPAGLPRPWRSRHPAKD